MLHLADIIEEEMKERGWSITDLVMHMGPHFTEKDWGITQLSWEMFFAVRDPDIALGEVMAEQLEAAFDVDRAFFVNLHEAWRKSMKEVI